MRSHLLTIRSALVAAAMVVLGACGGGSQSTATSAAADPATTEDTTPKSPDAPDGNAGSAEGQVDLAGAREALDLVTKNLDGTRSLLDTLSSDAKITTTQNVVREIRNSAFELDGELRNTDVGDADLAESVDGLLGTLGVSIGTYDTVTTADPSALASDEAVEMNGAFIDQLAAMADVQNAAASLIADGAPAADPAPSQILATIEDLGAGTIDTASAVNMAEGTLPTKKGPCGEPFPTEVVPPRAYAASIIQDWVNSATQRVFVMDNPDTAQDLLQALRSAWDCPSSRASTNVSVDEAAGVLTIQWAAPDGNNVDSTHPANILAVAEGSRVLYVSTTGDGVQIANGDASALNVSDAVLAAMRANLAG